MSIKVPQWLMDSSHWARSLSARRHILRQARDNRRKLIAGALLAPLYLRAMTKTGEVPCTLGRPIISNYGRCEFGDRILMNSRPVKIVISVDDAAELICGDDAFLNYGVCIEATRSIIIGDRCLLGPMTSIVDNAFHGLYQRYVRPEPKPVRLGNDVWLGRGVSILPGVTIGDGAVVGSGSVVTHDVAAYSVVAGVPAHKIKDLDPQDFVVQALEYANRLKRAR